MRRAVWLGVVRTGFVAAAWLLVGALLVLLAGIVLAGVRGERFADIARYGAMTGHPEYAVGDATCCSGLGYTLTREMYLTARGAVGAAGTLKGEVREGLAGAITADLPPAAGSPIGDALRRGRPAKEATTAFLATLPPSMVASAIVEYATPRTPAEFQPSALPALVFFSPPYDEPVATWDFTDLKDFRSWAGGLRDGDDDMLRDLDAPTAKQLRAIAADPRITGTIVERASIADLRALLTDPKVQSVNIAAAGFDPAQQFPGS
jgi:hypothetical protein